TGTATTGTGAVGIVVRVRLAAGGIAVVWILTGGILTGGIIARPIVTAVAVPVLRRAGGRIRFGRGRSRLVDRLGGLPHGLFELFLADPRLVEGVAATAVRQRQFGGHPHILLFDRVRAAPGGVRGGS